MLVLVLHLGIAGSLIASGFGYASIILYMIPMLLLRAGVNRGLFSQDKADELLAELRQQTALMRKDETRRQSEAARKPVIFDNPEKAP